MTMKRSRPLAAAALLLFGTVGAVGQDITPPGWPPPLGPITSATPAKQLFGRVREPSAGPQQSIGFYSNGCLAGASALPLTGPTWQVMRPSRNRFYGRAKLIAFIQRLSKRVAATTAWPGILIGDMSQPRGGPMLQGHASHQIGLDVDVWLKPMATASMSMAARESLMSTVVVAPDRRSVGSYWTSDHLKVIKAAASDPDVERVLVNPAIKKAICEQATGDRSWLQKVRPNWGHDYHMHIRLGCPPGEPLCKPQRDVVPGEGCGRTLDYWFQEGILHPKPPPVPPKPLPPLTLAKMPAQCAGVLNGP